MPYQLSMEQLHTPVAHVVILPFPAQGHVKPMFKLAKILCHHPNFHVTFVNSDHNHDRFLNSIDLPALNHRLPNLRLESIPDGLPPEHPRIGHGAVDLFFSTRSITTKQHFKDLLKKESWGGRLVLPPTCVIADGIMSFAIDVAEELDVPIITFRTYSASCTWLYFHFQKLIQQGEIPFPENEDMDRPISCVPGFESILRRRDLPGFIRSGEIENPILEFYISQTTAMTRASALILDTFEELESPFISRLASLFPKIYTIGPLHVHGSKTETSSSSDVSLWKQDRNCITWLDSHPSKSVLYVSFGSIITLTRDQLLEFWFGVVNSGQRFLWVMRPDLVAGDDGGVAGVGQIPVELLEVTEQRGFIVSWAPQDEVLAHEAIGGFLTHTGWNSTLESIYTGVPMIGWPQMADQQFNSRCVSEVWKIGFDMKDTCDRFTVEKMVRLLMEDDHDTSTSTSTREEIMKSTVEISNMARDSVKQGGSSYCSLQNLIHDIQSMCLKN